LNKLKINGIYCINLLTSTTVFSYAILYSTLSLYLNEIIRYSKHQSNCTVGIFIAFNFLLHLFAGYLGGRWLSNKQLLFIALSSQCIGSLILQYNYLYAGLSFFLIGCGFGITCLNCLLTEQFDLEDQRREKAFFLNYAALNFGSFLGFLVSGYFYSSHNFNFLFQINTYSSFIALILLLLLSKNIKTMVSSNLKKLTTNFFIGISIITLLFLFVFLGFYFENTVNNIIIISSLVTVSYIAIQAKRSNNNSEKNKLYVFLLFLISAIFFWTLYFIGPMALIFFLKNNVRHTILGYEIPPQWFMNFDTLMIIIFSPILGQFFQHLKRKGLFISTSKKFSFALLTISISYLLMYLGIKRADMSGLISLNWIFLYYLLQSLGELLIAPTGYAMIGQLAPQHLQGIMMGTWMMVCGIATILSHHVSDAMTIENTNNPLISNSDYLLVFGNLGLYAIVSSIFLFFLSKKNRLPY
jgi:amino acid/peptide:H+ symporter